MNLSTRLTVAMVSLVLLTAGAVGFLAYRNLEAAILPSELTRLDTRARLQAASLDGHVRSARADVLASTGPSAFDSYLSAHFTGGIDPQDGIRESVWRERYAKYFVAQLAAKPEYAQLRLIGVADGGREIIRVDRSGPGGTIRVVPESGLQTKGDRPYFQNTLRLAASQVYVSPLELNQEHGAVETPHLAAVRVSTPVFGPDGKPFGIVIINIDMRPALAELRRSVRPGGQVYVVNENGDYLLHPDASHEFGFDLGKTYRLQNDFPSLAQALATGETTAREVSNAAGKNFLIALVPIRLAGGSRVTVVEALPSDVAFASATAVEQSSLMGAIIAALCAGLLAVFTARSLTRPLKSLAQSLDHFTGEENVNIPERAAGEIGVLARALKRMADAVREKTATIRQYAEREKLYLAAVESANDAFVTCTLDGTITNWNPAAERIFGYTANEAIGQKTAIIATSDKYAEQHENLEKVRRGERIENFETVRVAKDGTPIDVSITISPLRSASGEIVGASEIKRDITERNRSEKVLRQYAERERLYIAAVESANDAIFTVDLAGNITTWNPAAERLFGFSAAAAIGKSFSLIATPDQQKEQKANFERIMRGDRLENFETVRTRKDGTAIDLSYNSSPVLSASGEVVGASTIARDITERKQADAMFRKAVESSPGAMVMADAAGKIVLVNAETERMFGYARGELVGMPIETLIPKKLRDAHVQHRNTYAANPSQKIGAGRDLFGTRKDGSEITVEVGLNPIMTRDGLLVLAAIVDVTERKRHEKVIAERALELQRSNAELEQFAYVASHDLQEPLRMVASYAELLADRYQGKLDDKADKYIAYAVDGAKRMQRLVNDLLTYSRVGTQGRELLPTDTNIVAGHVLRTLKGKIEENGATVEVGSLPVVNADEGQLGQLFQNLIGNALKFRNNNRPLRVRVGAQPSRQGWIFFVEDNGIGIEAQYAERVFQMFQRLHDREAYEGSGIGLTIAKKIVERHGGRIWFESEPGKGTTFFFTLPATQEKAA